MTDFGFISARPVACHGPTGDSVTTIEQPSPSGLVVVRKERKPTQK